MSIKNKAKYSNIVTVITMLVSTFFFIKIALKEGIEQVGFLTTTLYVAAIVVSIISFVVHWKTKQVIKKNEGHAWIGVTFSFVLNTTSNSQNTMSWEGRVWCGFESEVDMVQHVPESYRQWFILNQQQFILKSEYGIVFLPSDIKVRNGVSMGEIVYNVVTTEEIKEVEENRKNL